MSNNKLKLGELLSVLNVNGLIENCKIEPLKKHLFSQVVDPDRTMMGEIRYKNDTELNSIITKPIAIFDVSKLLSMISYVDGSSKSESNSLDIDNDGVLTYRNGVKKIVYRLGDEDVIPTLDIERNVKDFINDEDFKFRLNNKEMRDLLKALSISERDSSLEISYAENDDLKLTVGKIDKIILTPESDLEFMHEEVDSMIVCLQTRIISNVLKTMLMFPNSEVVVYCKTGFPAVLQLSTNDYDIEAEFIISPEETEE